MKFKNIKFKILQIFALIMHYVPRKSIYFYDLVIVRVDALGDYILWLDALQAYKKKYRGKKVLLICADLVEPLAKEESLFTEVWSFNRKEIEKNFFYFFKQLSHWRIVFSETVVYPVWQRHRIGDMIVSAIMSDHSVGMEAVVKDSLIVRLYNIFFTQLIPVDNLNNEIKAIEVFTKEFVDPDYFYGLRKCEYNFKCNLVKSPEYIVFAISASIGQKIWPMARFAELADSLSNYVIVIIGAGEKDFVRAEEICSKVKNRANLVNLINKTSVVEMVDVISKAKFVVGNDSAAVHIAAATHVPSIAIMHGAHFGRFLPYPSDLPNKEYHPHIVSYQMNCYGCGYHCIYGQTEPFECLNKVSVEMVSKEIMHYNEII